MDISLDRSRGHHVLSDTNSHLLHRIDCQVVRGFVSLITGMRETVHGPACITRLHTSAVHTESTDLDGAILKHDRGRSDIFFLPEYGKIEASRWASCSWVTPGSLTHANLPDSATDSIVAVPFGDVAKSF